MKRRIEFDKNELLDLAKSLQPISRNISDLGKKIAEEYKKKGKVVSFATVVSRLKSYGYSPYEKIDSVLDVLKSVPSSNYFGRLKQVTPKKFHHIVDKYSKGSKIAAVKLKCLDCSGFDKKEVKYCQVSECALWMIRPYRPKDKS